MKLSTVLELIGSGWILLVAGISMLGFGIAYGLTEAVHLPLWACLCGIGLFTAIVGFAFVDRGNVEAEQQVKRMPLIVKALRSPWLTLGASIVGGILLQRLTRSRQEVIVEKAPVEQGSIHDDSSSQQSVSAKSSAHGVSHYLTEQLQTLGLLAGGIAFSLGMEVLGIPSVKQLLGDLLGGNERDGNADGTGRSSQNGAQCRSSREFATSHQPSHNGSNSPEEFDPIV